MQSCNPQQPSAARGPLPRAVIAAVAVLAVGVPLLGSGQAEASSTLTSVVSAGADDGYTAGSTSLNGTATTATAGRAWGTREAAFFRFQGLTVPKGAVVESARLRLQTTWGSGSAVRLRIAAADVDSATAPVSAGAVSAMVATTAQVAWAPTSSALGAPGYGAKVSTPDVRAVVQEVVDRGGWAGGNALLLRLADDGSADGAYVNFATRERAGTTPATLDISWSVAAAAPPSAAPPAAPAPAPSATSSQPSAAPTTSTAPSTAPGQQTSVLPTALGTYVANPGIGWQEATTPSNPILPETTPYRRADYSWSAVNPADGVYDFSRIDADVSAARSAGKQLSFRLYTMRGESFGGSLVPQWVRNAGATTTASGEPDYGNCVYQAQWARTVEALRQRYDGNGDVAFLDISGYGNFNEWSWQDQTQFDDNALSPTTIDGQARKRLADMFLGGSATVQCRSAAGVSSVAYSYPGFSRTQLVMPYAGVVQSLDYVLSRRSDIGLRHDCLGRMPVTDRFIDRARRVWRQAPVVFELCSGSTGDAAYISRAADVLRATHGSAVHDNLTGTRSAAVLENLMRDVGYRFVIASASHSASAAPGGALSYDLTWRNVGYAPAYARTGQSFDVKLGLRASDGRLLTEWVVPGNVSQWMPADPVPGTAPANRTAGTVTVPSTQPAGTYTVTAAVVDRRTGKAVQLAIGGRGPDGRYALGQLTIG